ncbi:MAG TPA: ATP-binding protein, partial [Methanothrix soehngenii]|nr:ATP-binding protein [Methanothrix soehngenii]
MEEEDDTGKLSPESQKIRERIRTVANAHDAPVSEDAYEQAAQAASRTLSDRRLEIQEERARKWDLKVPPRWSGWSIDQLPKPLQLEANQWISEGFDNAENLILSGPTGSGKTSMAYAIGKVIYSLGHKVKVWSAAELFDEMRTAEQSKVVLQSVKSSPLLILDDLGSERKTEWVEERLFLIVDFRWQW